jgi:hypothetical protein
VPRRKTQLQIVAVPDIRASILQPNAAPAFKGNESEDLLCGSCGIILAQGVSSVTLNGKFAAPVQLLVKCPKCAGYNRLPAQVGN